MGHELFYLGLGELRTQLDVVLDRLPKKARSDASKALALAEEAHSVQARDDGTPYLTHPLRVALSLAWELDVWDLDLLCAALLHDALEDGKDVTFSRIKSCCGERVAHIVQDLSKPGDPSKNHEQINELYFSRLLQADKDCKLVKLADKLDNVRDAVNSPDPAKQQRTVTEAKDFYLKLARSLIDVQRQQIILDLLQDAIRSVENQSAAD